MDEIAKPKEPKPKPYTLAREPGGKIPDPGQLFSATMAEFMDNIGGYLQVGLAQFVVVLPVTMVAVFVIYFGMFVVMFGGMGLSAVIGVAIGEGTGNDDAAGAVMGLGYLASFAGMFAFLFGAVGAIAALVAPVTASLNRAIAAHQRGEGTLDFAAAFSTITRDLVQVIGVTLAVTLVILCGMMFCYVPGLAAIVLLSFAPTMVFLHRQPVLTSLRTAVAHAMQHGSFYLIFGAMYFAIMLIASYVPILGPMFGAALHIRAYREIFGDGDAPVIS